MPTQLHLTTIQACKSQLNIVKSTSLGQQGITSAGSSQNWLELRMLTIYKVQITNLSCFNNYHYVQWDTYLKCKKGTTVGGAERVIQVTSQKC